MNRKINGLFLSAFAEDYGLYPWMSATMIGGSAKFFGGNAKIFLLRRMFAERAKLLSVCWRMTPPLVLRSKTGGVNIGTTPACSPRLKPSAKPGRNAALRPALPSGRRAGTGFVRGAPFIIPFLIILLGSQVTLGESTASLNLNDIINEALINNPQIKASHKRYEAGLARVKLLRSLTDPRFEYEYDKITADMDAVMKGKTGPMRTFAISQEIPFPTKLFLRHQAAQKEADALKEDYKEKENEIIQKVKESYFMLSLANKEIQITQDTKVLLGQLIQTLTNRYSVGQATQQEVLKAQSEYSKLDNNVVLLEQKKKIAQAMLKSLLNRSQDTDISDPPQQLDERDLEIDKAELIKLMKDNRPELKSFKEMVRKSVIEFTLAKQEYLPDFMVKYKREEKNGSAGSWAGMLGVTIPLWFWEKQDSFVKEAKVRLDEMELEYHAMENMVSYEVEAALAKVEAQQRLAKLYETSFLPQAEAAFKASSIGFEAGKNDFLNLLDSERMLLEFKLDYANVLVDLEIAYADLERAVGVNALVAFSVNSQTNEVSRRIDLKSEK